MVRLRSPAPKSTSCGLHMGDFPSGQRGQTVNLLRLRFGGPNPPSPTNKNRTFVGRQMFCFCLSIAKAMAYHHALACISSPQAHIINRRLYFFRNDDIQNFVLIICNFFEIGDIPGFAVIFIRAQIHTTN